MLLLFFFVGGVAGAFGFKQVGYAATVPLALASVPIVDDVARVLRRRQQG